MLLNDGLINQEIMETNVNENTTVQNLWNAAKAVLKGKIIAKQAYLKKKNLK